MSKTAQVLASAKPLSSVEFARLLYVASACRLWLRQHTTLRTRRRMLTMKTPMFRSGTRKPASRWDWTSSTAVMR